MESPSTGFVVWMTGLSAAGKTTLANGVGVELEHRGLVVDYLDGDVVRQHLCKDLGFSREDRDANIARIGWVASRLARAGAAVLVSAISPFESARKQARSLVEEHAPFVEVYVATPLDECMRRDPKGLYARALSGELRDFTGISAPYEPPTDPDLMITSELDPDDSVERVVNHLRRASIFADVRPGRPVKSRR